MMIEDVQVIDTSLEELVRQSLQDQMTGLQLSPAIQDRMWRRIVAWAACGDEEDAEAETLPIDIYLEGSHLA